MGSYSDYTNRELRGPQGIINTVRAERQYPGKASLSFLIVEGDTDKRVYQAYVNVQVCRIVVAYNKDAAVTVLSILEGEAFPGILAIVDADFKALGKADDQSSSLLFTDVVGVLSLGLRKAIGTSKVVELELLESLLRLAYERSYFRQTQLYTAIQQWENANPPYVVLLMEK